MKRREKKQAVSKRTGECVTHWDVHWWYRIGGVEVKAESVYWNGKIKREISYKL
jgi:hypothetical protein